MRPTADRVKEALFSILASRFDLVGIAVLDLFAGSGAIGIEALSRGAATATFVEQHRATCTVLRENVAACGFQTQATLLCAETRRALRDLTHNATTFDGVFIDPPYRRDLASATLAQLGTLALLKSGGWVIVEHHTDDTIDPAYGILGLTHTRGYGKTCLSLFQVGAEESPQQV